ncbi:hypothetical protein EJ06DRAFT_231018 [Trichodelitschia bisporula]|uniref:Uncharacterized protein n=1 Tax=Trichodelitschia bisporula TaxID=703511 RepID=A0A6G1HLC8_9PEZI|nr:hypothetical protein EJ06DRAFT_231018 [Trichodelitschia bisporula]
MAFWPFRRKRRRTVSTAPEPAPAPAALYASDPDVKSKDFGHPASPTSPTSPSDPNLYRPLTTLSAEDITALPRARALHTSPHLRPVRHDADIPYDFRLPSSTSLAMRNNEDDTMPRRKPSKKRKRPGDKRLLREEELRAMSAPMRVPSRRGPNLLRKDSRRVRDGLGVGRRGFERPVSQVSLPLEDSVHEDMEAWPPHAVRLSMMNMLAPRPVIRYATMAHLSSSSEQLEQRAASRAHRRPQMEALREDTKIDGLADDLDSSGLREIMERDQRRRDRKRRTHAERVKVKLEEPRKKSKRGRRRREPDVRPATDVQPEPAAQPEPDVQQTADVHQHPEALQKLTIPPMPLLEDNEPEREPEPVPIRDIASPSPTPTPLESPTPTSPLSPRRIGMWASIFRREHSSPHRRSTRHDSGAALSGRSSREPHSPSPMVAGVGMGGVSDAFNKDKGVEFPSEPQSEPEPERSFSNTSRESIMARHAQGALPPAHLYQPPSGSTRSGSVRVGGSIRATSRFREDLPELSVPLQSGTPTPVATPLAVQPPQTPDKTRRHPYRSGSPAEAVLGPSRSLASIDSEGEWLASGGRRVSSRVSSRAGPVEDEEEDEVVRKGGGIARTPTVIWRENRVKSSEGLLREAGDGDDR